MVYCLVEKVSTLNANDQVAASLKNAILNECQKRFGPIENVHLLAISTLLDPRFKKIHFKDPLACSKAIKQLRELAENISSTIRTTTGSSSPTATVPSSSKDTYSIWSRQHQLVESQEATNSTIHEDEVSLYFRIPVCEFSKNPFEVWQQLSPAYLTLFKVAQKYLTTVATSVPSERHFSKAGQVLTQLQNRLKGSRLSKLLFLQSLDKKIWDMA